MADLKAEIIKRALNGDIPMGAINDLAEEYGCTAQNVRKTVRAAVKRGYLIRYYVTESGRAYIEAE